MGSKSTNVTQQNTPNWQTLANYQTLTNKANALQSQSHFQPYPGQFVAPLTPLANQGVGGTQAYAQQAQPSINAALANTAGGMNQANPTQFSSAGLNQYLSPYTQDVINATQAEFANQNTQQAQSLEGSTIGAGAFGGDRAGIAQAALANQQQLAQAPTIAGLENQNYNQALSEFNTQQGVNLGAQQANLARQLTGAAQLGNLGVAQQNASLQGANAELAAGQYQQQNQQALDTAYYNQFLQQQAYPFQTLGWAANIGEGIGSNTGGTSTTTAPGPSLLGQATGAGLLGLGLYNSGALTGAGSALGSLGSTVTGAAGAIGSGLGSLGSGLGAAILGAPFGFAHGGAVIGKTMDGRPIYRYKLHGDARERIFVGRHQRASGGYNPDQSLMAQLQLAGATSSTGGLGAPGSGGSVGLPSTLGPASIQQQTTLPLTLTGRQSFEDGGAPQISDSPYAYAPGYVPTAGPLRMGPGVHIPSAPAPQQQNSVKDVAQILQLAKNVGAFRQQHTGATSAQGGIGSDAAASGDEGGLADQRQGFVSGGSPYALWSRPHFDDGGSAGDGTGDGTGGDSGTAAATGDAATAAGIAGQAAAAGYGFGSGIGTDAGLGTGAPAGTSSIGTGNFGNMGGASSSDARGTVSIGNPSDSVSGGLGSGVTGSLGPANDAGISGQYGGVPGSNAYGGMANAYGSDVGQPAGANTNATTAFHSTNQAGLNAAAGLHGGPFGSAGNPGGAAGVSTAGLFGQNQRAAIADAQALAQQMAKFRGVPGTNMGFPAANPTIGIGGTPQGTPSPYGGMVGPPTGLGGLYGFGGSGVSNSSQAAADAANLANTMHDVYGYGQGAPGAGNAVFGPHTSEAIANESGSQALAHAQALDRGTAVPGFPDGVTAAFTGTQPSSLTGLIGMPATTMGSPVALGSLKGLTKSGGGAISDAAANAIDSVGHGGRKAGGAVRPRFDVGGQADAQGGGFDPSAFPADRAQTTPAQRDAFNRAYAAKIGLNPNIASGVAKAEGYNTPGAGPSSVDVDANGRPFSYGDYQLNVRNGLGRDAINAGIDPTDPKQWQQANMYAINAMKSGGLGPWQSDAFVKGLSGTQVAQNYGMMNDASSPYSQFSGVASPYPRPGQMGSAGFPADASQALMAAGAGMLASRSPFPGVALGEGAAAGLGTYREQQNLAREYALTNAQIMNARSEADLREGQVRLLNIEMQKAQLGLKMMSEDAGGTGQPATAPVAAKPVTPVPQPATQPTLTAGTGALPSPNAQRLGQAANINTAPITPNAVPSSAADLLRQRAASLNPNVPAAGATPVQATVPFQPPGQTAPAATPAISDTVKSQIPPEVQAQYDAMMAKAGRETWYNPQESQRLQAQATAFYAPYLKAAEAAAEERARLPYKPTEVQDEQGFHTVPLATLPGFGGQTTAITPTPSGGALDPKLAKELPSGLVNPGQAPPSGNVSKIAPDVQAYRTNRADEFAKSESAMDQAFQDRQVAKQRLEAMGRIVQDYQTGALAEEKGDAIRYAKALGLPVGDLEKNPQWNPALMQEFEKNGFAQVFSNLKATMGGTGRLLVSEVTGFMKANANKELEPAANAAILTQALGLMDYEDKKYNDFKAWHGQPQNKNSFDASQFLIPWAQQKENQPQAFIDQRLAHFPYQGQIVPPKEKLKENGTYMTTHGPMTWRGGRFYPAGEE